MSLSEFKVIFYWEYAHRLLARIVGLFSLIPLIIFYLKYKNTKFYSNKYFIIFILICLQGFIGWYMVSSGLIKNNDVSHFRLSVHLSLALLIISLIFWYILDIFKVNKYKVQHSNYLMIFILLIIILQIILGAFLSGLDGGLIYNTWPFMNSKFYPNDVDLYDYLNSTAFYNPSIIQFFHRILAYTLLFLTVILNYLFLKTKLNIKDILIFDLAIFLQVLLGILTLLSGVEIQYASLHQLGSIFVLSSFSLILYKNFN